MIRVGTCSDWATRTGKRTPCAPTAGRRGGHGGRNSTMTGEKSSDPTLSRPRFHHDAPDVDPAVTTSRALRHSLSW